MGSEGDKQAEEEEEEEDEAEDEEAEDEEDARALELAAMRSGIELPTT